MYEELAVLAVFVFVYSLAAGGLAKTPISAAMTYTAFGFAIGPLGLDLLKLDINGEQVRLFAELTLALVLFSDAANANLAVLKTSFQIPARLLLIGLPLTIMLGFGFGVLLFGGLTLFEVALLATILAPTDAALGKAVVSDPTIRPEIREGLNVESGLNDGICVPVLLLFLALAVHPSGSGGAMLALKLIAEQIGLGLVVGLALTALGVRLLQWVIRHEWVSQSWQQVPVPALALACFALTQWLGGSGFIAAFSGGLLFGWMAKQPKHALLLAAEGAGDTLALITWVMFGAVIIGRLASFITWQMLLYAVLSLTVIRILPVLLALVGTNLRASERLFVGWFGPRGLASIVFAVIVFDEGLAGKLTLAATVVCTVVLSIIAHGVSASPLFRTAEK